ncbi:precorrin-2 dehydrogenase/sirohydrochlorin ferrochelatase family protein [Sporomusa acidovorans]|uniref:precorrin-2 dehydrogenase n=1 Tax=Sporomusa acidovorans (strain ATCC 49682 / DSM 3132 / Mol) TaxID=1123286 RepID=A0ABZ3JAZ5_SPOA4|nr:bifunctional precorrin-2 dehydrogenase/sirohydrochlorin ferrochelatase [Sporomusa acidovorans]OZC22920.1 precorrin-2 dehydrogenase [Sporomusa acidovorans DSM 3132]SDE95202.1 precorrin-2 dehydrogenase / sirohydrochlorin ferrochelatase [Sporomusa acidovorans]
MELYPVNLKLAGRRCAVIGGGAVAERKVKSLITAGAQVTVFSPVLTPGLSQLQENGRLAWVARVYQAGDLHNFFLVFCATNEPAANRQAAKDAQAAGALVNVADAPELSDFYVPAHIVRGDLLLTISTGGGSPALARRLREEIAARYGPEYGHYLALIAKLRPELKGRLATTKEREKFWRETIDLEALDLLKQGKFNEAEERIRHAACCTGPES